MPCFPAPLPHCCPHSHSPSACLPHPPACLPLPGSLVPARLQVGQLREELAARGLKTQGTKQILLAKLTEALEKEVGRALGGERRLAQWAASAVGRMAEGEVLAELEARGVGQYSTPTEAAGALQALVRGP